MQFDTYIFLAVIFDAYHLYSGMVTLWSLMCQYAIWSTNLRNDNSISAKYLVIFELYKEVHDLKEEKMGFWCCVSSFFCHHKLLIMISSVMSSFVTGYLPLIAIPALLLLIIIVIYAIMTAKHPPNINIYETEKVFKDPSNSGKWIGN